MSSYTMVVFIVAIVVTGTVLKSIFQNKPERETQGKFEKLLRRMDQIEQSFTEVERRLKNLETIATSKDFNLHREFEKLEQEV